MVERLTTWLANRKASKAPEDWSWARECDDSKVDGSFFVLVIEPGERNLARRITIGHLAKLLKGYE